MEESPSNHVVGVGLCDSAPLLWRVEDLRSVRAQGLVGALLGSLPRTPRQNGRLGRPLLLLPEEERLLSERHATAALPPPDQVSLVWITGESKLNMLLSCCEFSLVDFCAGSRRGRACSGGGAEEEL